jgi:hypothetical protein
MGSVEGGGGILRCKVSQVHANIVVRQLRMISISVLHSLISSHDEVARDEKLLVVTSVKGSAFVNAK